MKLLLSISLLSLAYAQQIKTVMEFSRDLNTCDLEGDIPIEPLGTSRVVWAYSDQIPESPEEVTYHQDRGGTSLNIVGQPDEEPVIDPTSSPLDLVVDNIHVVNPQSGNAVDTLYYCKAFEMPHDKKRHITNIEFLIEEENRQYVHHMLLYYCPELHEHITFEGECYHPLNPDLINQCNLGLVLTGWAVGGQDQFLPTNVGFPLSFENRHMLIEIHYDNPTLNPNIFDSSGIRLWVTENLRPIDAGVAYVGHMVFNMDIPAQEEAYPHTGICSSFCTSGLPKEGVQIFSTNFHAHLASRQMHLQHLRDGRELPPIATDRYYDFNYQQTHATKPEVTIKPGDELVITCTYNTMDRNTTTPAGIATYEEMCRVFIAYYPFDYSFGPCESLPNPIQGGLLENCEYSDVLGQLTPMEYEPLPIVDECEGYEKPPLDRVPRRLEVFDRSKYEHRVELDPEGKYILYWNHDHVHGTVNFATEVATTGWVGFGVSENGGMIGADVVIGWQNRDTSVEFHDRKAIERILPGIDLSQDLYDIRVGLIYDDGFSNSTISKALY